jgi:hypothetical protein
MTILFLSVFGLITEVIKTVLGVIFHSTWWSGFLVTFASIVSNARYSNYVGNLFTQQSGILLKIAP